MGEGSRIGIIGGTFDPVHMGHLMAAEWARTAFDLDRLVFIPAGDPPLKDTRAVSNATHRYTMTLLATLTNPNFSVSRSEIDREGKSFTYDTLKAKREQLDEGDELFFIMGADSLAAIPRWHRPDELFSLCQLIVVTRPQWDFDHVAEQLGSLYEDNRQRIHRLDIPDIGISSRMIRQRVAEGATIRYLTPDVVIRYIEEYGLYARDEPGVS